MMRFGLWRIIAIFVDQYEAHMRVSIEKESDGTYIAYNTTGKKVTLIGTGDTVKDAKEDFFNSIAEVVDSYTARGEAVPKELKEPPEFHFAVTSLVEYWFHRLATELAALRLV